MKKTHETKKEKGQAQPSRTRASQRESESLDSKRRQEIARQLRLEVAYHEAGHAAMLFIFGQSGAIDFIEMRENSTRMARIRAELLYLPVLLSHPVESDSHIPVPYKCFAKQHMMYHLAGFAAQSRVQILDRKIEGWGWLHEELDSGEWDVEGRDVSRAWRTAKAVWGDNGNSWRMLSRMAMWVDEALSYPKLWAATQALAKHLVAVKYRMLGSCASRIMIEAWGDPSFLPYLEMGAKWRRRFPFYPKPFRGNPQAWFTARR